jgi:hypothetical protein
VSQPREVTLIALAAGLEVHPNELLGLDGATPP